MNGVSEKKESSLTVTEASLSGKVLLDAECPLWPVEIASASGSW